MNKDLKITHKPHHHHHYQGDEYHDQLTNNNMNKRYLQHRRTKNSCNPKSRGHTL